MKQNSFVVPKNNFAKSINFWLFQQNVLLGQQQKFCCINFFLSASSFVSKELKFISIRK